MTTHHAAFGATAAIEPRLRTVPMSRSVRAGQHGSCKAAPRRLTALPGTALRLPGCVAAPGVSGWVGLVLSVGLLAFASSVRAQPASSGVTQSTDSARSAAVEQEARRLQAEQAHPSVPGAAPSADGLVRGSSAGGAPYVGGGVTVGQRKSMFAMRKDYGLWVATVAKPSGAYLSDARLRITDLGTQGVVIELTMYGPWLLAALPPGDYEIQATLPAEGVEASQTLATRVHVVPGELRQAVLRFASSADVGPERDDPFGGNPFGASAPAR